MFTHDGDVNGPRDSGSEEWRDGHPQAFIVNHEQLPRATYVVLYRTDCVQRRTSRGASWTTAYSKTCGETLDDIRTWATSTVGRLDLHRCSFCDHQIRSIRRRVAHEIWIKDNGPGMTLEHSYGWSALGARS